MRDFYAERTQLELNKECSLQLGFNDIADLSFDDFAYLFVCHKNVLSKQPNRLQYHRYFVLRFWPHIKPHGVGAKYSEYCKFQLIRFKPWQNKPEELCQDFMSEKYKKSDKQSGISGLH